MPAGNSNSVLKLLEKIDGMDDVKIFTDEKNNVRSEVGIIGDQHLNAYLKNETMVFISSEPDKGSLKFSKFDDSDETEMEEDTRKLKNVDDKLVFDEPEMDSVQKGVSGLYIVKWKDDKERNTNFEKELVKSIEEFEEIKQEKMLEAQLEETVQKNGRNRRKVRKYKKEKKPIN
ncbi:unnamed protein product [Didymodactylos carnosus]|uniref:Uncharacterized protein n=1 Tax=Didymodactylos carnosus TaxID=1234261 RepID=A0A815QMP1_9BILA|nr:unnamed protein product [Didymodactylos carnosus]CAF4334700.1 unnamed protein product [Didymodactylos carnosus]